MGCPLEDLPHPAAVFVRVRTLPTVHTPSQGLPASASGPGRCRVSPKAVFNHCVFLEAEWNPVHC